MGLYIPYGSDKTAFASSMLMASLQLYIPYGSDKTCWCKRALTMYLAFISHMVQIKRG